MGTFVYSPDPLFIPGTSVDSTPVLQGFIEIKGGLNDHASGVANPHTISGSGTFGGVETAAVTGITIPASGATHLWTMIDRIAAGLSMALKGTAGSAPAASDWATLANAIPLLGGVSEAQATSAPGRILRRDANAAGSVGSFDIGGTGTFTNTQAQLRVQQFAGQTLPIVRFNNSAGTSLFSLDPVSGVTSGTFSGALTGNASTATSATSLTGINDLAHGGTGGTTAGTARASLSAAISGTNNDITSLTATFTAAISAQQGGTGLQNPTAGGLLVANGASAMTLVPPSTTGNVLQSSGGAWVSQPFNAAVTIPPGGITSDRLGPLYPTPGVGGGNALKAQVQGWQGFVPGVTNPVFIQFAGGLSPALDPSGITGGQSRIDLLLLNNSGNLAIQPGIAKATPLISDVVVPSNCIPIWWMKIYAGATTITGYTDTGVNACFLAEARPLYSLGGGGGSAGAPATGPSYATMNDDTATLSTSKRIGNKFFVTLGPDADLTNEQDITGLFTASQVSTVNSIDLSLPRIGLNKIASATNQATMDDFMNLAVSGNVQGAITTAGGTVTMKVQPNLPPIYVRQGTKEQRLDSTQTSGIVSNTVTLSGTYKLVAETSAAGNHFSILLVITESATQVPLQRFYYDSSANVLYNLPPHGPYSYNKPHLTSANVTDLQTSTTYADTAALVAVGAVTQLPGTTPLTIYLPDDNMVAFVEIYGHIQSTATAGDFRVYGMASIGTGAAVALMTNCYSRFAPAVASSVFPFFAKAKLTGLGSGALNIGVGYYAVPASYVVLGATVFLRVCSSVQTR